MKRWAKKTKWRFEGENMYIFFFFEVVKVTMREFEIPKVRLGMTPSLSRVPVGSSPYFRDLKFIFLQTLQ